MRAEKNSVDLADVTAVVADASEMALDDVVDAAFAGRTGEIDSEFSKARASGSSPAAIISAAIRHVANLHKMKMAIEGGDTIDIAMKRAAPPVHFTRERQRGRSAARMDPARLLRAMEQLAEASLEMRRNAALSETIALRTLLSLAMSARKRPDSVAPGFA